MEQEVITKMYLLGNNLLALHGTGGKEGLTHVLVHSVDSFQPYFDPPSDELSSSIAPSPILYPPPTPTPTPSLSTSTPTPTPARIRADPAPTPKITTNIPTKGLTCLIRIFEDVVEEREHQETKRVIEKEGEEHEGEVQ